MENEANLTNQTSQPTAEDLVNPEETLEKIKKGIKDWLKIRSNLIFAISFIAIIAFRFYYFWLTRNQPVWWDESEYLSAAKSFAGIVEYDLHEQRLPGYPLLMSTFFIMGLTSEVLLRFFFNFIPSIIAILIFYFLIFEMYSDKRIAIISTIIFSVLWEHLFYSNRFHTENIALVFQFFALLILFRTYMKKKNLWIIKPWFSLILILTFSAISILMRPGNLPFFPALVLFIFLLNIPLILNKKYRKYVLTFLLILIIATIYILFNLSKIPLLKTYYHPERPISWSIFSIFKGFFVSANPNFPSPLFYLFIFGSFLTLIKVFLLIDQIKRVDRSSNILDFKSDIFNLLLVSSVFFVFIFLMRTTSFEYRWFFLFFPAILPFTARGMIFLSETLGNLLGSKKVITLIIILILSLGVYNQVVYADQIIKNKLNSYSQIRDAGLWVRANSNPEDIVLSRSLPQTVYYTERKTLTFSQFNESQFFELVKKHKPSLMIETIFEPHHIPEWGYNPTEKMMKMLIPIQAWYADPQQTQLMVIVYKIVYESSIGSEVDISNLNVEQDIPNLPIDSNILKPSINPSSNTSNSSTESNNHL